MTGVDTNKSWFYEKIATKVGNDVERDGKVVGGLSAGAFSYLNVTSFG